MLKNRTPSIEGIKNEKEGKKKDIAYKAGRGTRD